MSSWSSRHNLTSAFRGLNQKASLLVALSPTFSTAWSCCVSFCNSKGLQPLKTSGNDLVLWIKLIQGSKILKLVADHLKAIRSIRHAASKPIEDIHLPFSMFIEKIQKAKEANFLLLSELEPDLLQEVIHKAIHEFGLDSCEN